MIKLLKSMFARKPKGIVGIIGENDPAIEAVCNKILETKEPVHATVIDEDGDGYLDEEKVFLVVGSKVHCVEERAVAFMLLEDIVFISGHDYVAPWDKKQETSAVVVNCNDLFWWATADAEPLPNSEIGNLYKMWKANPQWGVSKWCCLRRQLRPQEPIVRDMKKDGFWDADLEALPPPERS